MLMFIITIIFVIATLIGTLLITKKEETIYVEKTQRNKTIIKYNKKLSIILSIIMLIIMILFSSFSIVGVGEVGIKTRFGEVIGKPLNPGLQMKLPYIEKVNIMDTKIKKIEVDAASASKDLQTVSSKIAINYSVVLEDANNLFQKVGLRYEDIIISPAIQESVKAATALYTAEELITKRQEVSQKMLENINNKIKSRGLSVANFNIINFDFSAGFNAAIEAKQVAQQNVLKAQQELEQTKIEAEKKVAQAEADAKAKIANAEAEAQSLRLQKQEITEDMLRLREIEVQAEFAKKWDGKLPVTMFGDSIPFVNFNK